MGGLAGVVQLSAVVFCLFAWLVPAPKVSAVVVGFDAFSYPEGAVNGRNGGAGWNRAGGLTSWSGGASLPSVSGSEMLNVTPSRPYIRR